jgi:hypothetical protein
MRYPDGGGLDAGERARREQVRLAAAELSSQVAVSAAVDLPPRVKIAQSADLSTVMTYLGERARDEVRGRVRGTRRAGNAQAASWRLRGIRVPSGRHFELVVIGPLDRLAESLPAVTQRGDGLGSAGEDRVMG